MQYPEEIIKDFKSISLDEINSIKDSVKLLDRHDTKFVFSSDKLSYLMENLVEHYRILEIDGLRIFGYENLYFDSQDFLFYRQHHRGKLNRYKMRFRRYTDSDLKYWEIKFKSNTGKTIKNRYKWPTIEKSLSEDAKKIIRDEIPDSFKIDPNSINPALWTNFLRVTLANTNLGERLTIDTKIKFKTPSGIEKCLEGVAVAELKQPGISLRSPFVISAKEEKIYNKPFSKYCTGISLLETSVKRNRFKKRLLFLEKITGGKLKCLNF